jgi:hypothetical protein
MSNLNQDQFSCKTCGQSGTEEDKVLGNTGCPSCGRTMPFLARPQGGRIVTGTKRGGGAYWMTPETTVVRKEGSKHIAASYGPDRTMYIHGEGRTGQEAVNDVMSQMAKQQGRKWWPTTHKFHQGMDEARREMLGEE